MAPPDLLVAGHIVKDITADGWRPGGSVLYAAAQAQKLGLRAGAVTVCGPDVQPQALLDVEWHIVRDTATTSFGNRYEAGSRTQRVPVTARPLNLEDIPSDWRTAPIILLAPVFHDIAPGLPSQLAGRGALLGLGAQGWLRSLHEGRVVAGRVEARPAWLAGDAVFVSEEDVIDPEAVSVWQRVVPVVVLTRAGRGCSVWDATGRHDLAAFATNERDPTGAGDVFATAFLIRLKETGDTMAAARFGMAAAALAVRQAGTESIGGREEIEALIAAEPVKSR
ncbi:MAG: sugar kinase [Dehalococcoidia bacterium]|nr:sugar kinase [Dehalococcoidia bacterium]